MIEMLRQINSAAVLHHRLVKIDPSLAPFVSVSTNNSGGITLANTRGGYISSTGWRAIWDCPGS